MADIKGNDHIKEFSYDNSELSSIVVNNNNQSIVFGSGGSAGGFVTKDKTITANGTYSAEDENCDGFANVTVNVNNAKQTSKSVYLSESGTTIVYPDDGYAAMGKVNIEVADSIKPVIIPLTDFDDELKFAADGKTLQYTNNSDQTVNIKGSYFINSTNKTSSGFYNGIAAGATDNVSMFSGQIPSDWLGITVFVLDSTNSKVLKVYVINK